MGKTNKKTVAIEKEINFIFDVKNYKLILIGLAVVILGFILMVGDENIYDFRKITLAPITVLAGFGVIMYGIIKKPSEESKSN
ncbi:MAG: hypothetical protein ACJAZ3_000684 [Sphingobacteriales bacterium]|jgi:hypothetical protein